MAALRQNPAGNRLKRQFADFHEANPHVYRRLVEMTWALKHKGHSKVGIGMLFEVLRWEHYMENKDPHSEFKLNNNYRAYYARMIMKREKGLADIFETRELRA